MKTVNTLARKAQKKGFTLLELSISIVMIILLGLGIFVLVRSVQSSTRAQTELGNINAMAACFNSTFQGDYASLSQQSAFDADCLPYTMKPSNAGVITSAWGTNVAIAPGATRSTFTITYPGVSSDVCKKLLPGLAKVYEDISIGGTSGIDRESTPAEIIAACNGANNGALVVTGR